MHAALSVFVFHVHLMKESTSGHAMYGFDGASGRALCCFIVLVPPLFDRSAVDLLTWDRQNLAMVMK